MKKLRFIFADQLSYSISSLTDVSKEDIILLCEVMEEATYVKHHPKKIAFLFGAMRHFAEELNEQGYQIRYIKLTDPSNTQTLNGEIIRAVKEYKVDQIIITEPS